jgi:hypothetical protein
MGKALGNRGESQSIQGALRQVEGEYGLSQKGMQAEGMRQLDHKPYENSGMSIHGGSARPSSQERVVAGTHRDLYRPTQ